MDKDLSNFTCGHICRPCLINKQKIRTKISTSGFSRNMSLNTFCDVTVSFLNFLGQFSKNVRYFGRSRRVWNIKSLSSAVLHELVTQKLKKKSFSSISLNIAQFYFHRLERKKLFKIDSLIIKIQYKMADLCQFKI